MRLRSCNYRCGDFVPVAVACGGSVLVTASPLRPVQDVGEIPSGLGQDGGSQQGEQFAGGERDGLSRASPPT